MTRKTAVPHYQHILGEARWLLSFGINPDQVAAQLGRRVDSIQRLAKRHGDEEMVQAFKGTGRHPYADR